MVNQLLDPNRTVRKSQPVHPLNGVEIVNTEPTGVYIRQASWLELIALPLTRVFESYKFLWSSVLLELIIYILSNPTWRIIKNPDNINFSYYYFSVEYLISLLIIIRVNYAENLMTEYKFHSNIIFYIETD